MWVDKHKPVNMNIISQQWEWFNSRKIDTFDCWLSSVQRRWYQRDATRWLLSELPMGGDSGESPSGSHCAER